MLYLPEVDTPSGPAKLHNHYEPHKFLFSPQLGRLVNKYEQRAMIVTEDLIAGFNLALEEEVGDAASEIMYRCGYEWGKEDIESFCRNMEVEFGRSVDKMYLGMVLETWWWPWQVSGWGAWKYDLSHKKEGLIFVDIFHSAVAESAGNLGKVVCHYYAGMFAAVFSKFAKKELGSIEIQCYSMGEDFCKFLIGSSKRINASQFWVREGASAQEIIDRL